MDDTGNGLIGARTDELVVCAREVVWGFGVGNKNGYTKIHAASRQPLYRKRLIRGSKCPIGAIHRVYEIRSVT